MEYQPEDYSIVNRDEQDKAPLDMISLSDIDRLNADLIETADTLGLSFVPRFQSKELLTQQLWKEQKEILSWPFYGSGFYYEIIEATRYGKWIQCVLNVYCMDMFQLTKTALLPSCLWPVGMALEGGFMIRTEDNLYKLMILQPAPAMVPLSWRFFD